MKKSRYSEEQIIEILKQSEAGVKTAELCWEHGISAATFYDWEQKFGSMDVSEAQRLKAMVSVERTHGLQAAGRGTVELPVGASSGSQRGAAHGVGELARKGLATVIADCMHC